MNVSPEMFVVRALIAPARNLKIAGLALTLPQRAGYDQEDIPVKHRSELSDSIFDLNRVPLIASTKAAFRSGEGKHGLGFGKGRGMA